MQLVECRDVIDIFQIYNLCFLRRQINCYHTLLIQPPALPNSKNPLIRSKAHQRQGRRIPPSNLQILPVAQEFQIIEEDSLANYSGLPNLPQGIWVFIWSIAFFWRPSAIGVRKTPGAIAITLILYFPRSLARGTTIPLTAPFEAAQIVCPLCPSKPATLLTKMIAPRSPSTSGCSDIALAASLATLKLPTTLI